MAKRLVVLVGMLAILLAVAVPTAFAQQAGPTTITATGELVGPVEDNDPDPTPEFRLTDEATGTTYNLSSGFVDLESYAGQRVTIEGVRVPGIDPSAFNVTRIQPADGPSQPPPTDECEALSPTPELCEGGVEEEATLSFELTVKGTPPEGVRFFGSAVGEGGPGVPLTDPDGDGIFTGSVTVPRFPPGLRPVPEGTDPLSLPVRIVQVEQGPFGPGEPSVIKDFGVVPLDGDKTFKARVNFKKGAVSPEEPKDECLALSPNPEECDAYVGPGGSGGDSDSGDSDSGGTGSSGPGVSGSGSGNSASVSGSDSAGGSSSGSSSSGGGEVKASGKSSGGGTKELPRTGGAIPALGLMGALLVGGGLLARRATR